MLIYRYKAVASPLKYKVENTSFAALLKVGISWIIGSIAPSVVIKYTSSVSANQMRAGITLLDIKPHWMSVAFLQVCKFILFLQTTMLSQQTLHPDP